MGMKKKKKRFFGTTQQETFYLCLFLIFVLDLCLPLYMLKTHLNLKGKHYHDIKKNSTHSHISPMLLLPISCDNFAQKTAMKQEWESMQILKLLHCSHCCGILVCFCLFFVVFLVVSFLSFLPLCTSSHCSFSSFFHNPDFPVLLHLRPTALNSVWCFSVSAGSLLDFGFVLALSLSIFFKQHVSELNIPEHKPLFQNNVLFIFFLFV